jgi:hypothetical protein
MADNLEDEHLENQTDNPSEISSDEISPTKKIENLPPTQAPETMEVHHHAHDPAAPHHKKNWKSYFWEFLMLFLAVFCGFLAEYQLEHKIENDREKEFISNLLEDLAEDTIAITNTIAIYKESEIRNDTLLRLLCSPDVKNHGATLYQLGRMASRSGRLAIHDATIQQLRNSGGFRLIRKEKASKAIIEYYNRLVFINYLQKIEDDEIMEYRKLATEVFHPVIFNSIVVEKDNSIILPEGNPALLTYDPKTLYKLAGLVSYVRNTRLGLANAETEMKASANELIALIKKEYHIE